MAERGKGSVEGGRGVTRKKGTREKGKHKK
jgi:hypothetical protein